ncbi:Phosphorylated carbohydrates phosphatase [Pseudobythopirellula maris]|uniref:Phosphorylated carbohydrates phosphatase n=1 Tax=Pseudobythopirellula maris TaxID=2527991 RepID=A0A5C5ZSW1_9BACT|nr:HAD family phosphatase [Pseudobythopirellula maris]TWT90624.1 Phosphorylated carbohydrates phosphatase [Pseudobythopirellula maris]
MTYPAPEKPIRAVAFDMDGVLASSEDVYELTGAETLKRRGRTFEDDLRHKMMGLPAAKALGVMIEHHGLDDTVEALEIESEEIFWSLAGGLLTPMPHVVETLDLLDRVRMPRGVVTSGSRRYAERILATIGVLDRMAFLITADDIRIGKPDPEPYLMAAERHGVEPAEMLVFEDSRNGSRAGVAAGAYTVAVPSPHTTHHDFTGVKFVADTLGDPRIATVLGLA